METNKLIAGIVAAAIAIIILAGVLIPALSTATTTTDTITNEGYLRMSHVETDDATEYVITYDYNTNRNVITVNGEDVKIENLPNESFNFNVVFDTNWLIRAVVGTDPARVTGLQYYTTSGGVTSMNSMTLTCQSGSYTLSGNSGAISKSGTFTDLYIPDNEGYYIMKDKNKPAHMLEDSEFIGFGLTAMINPVNPDNRISPGLGLLVTGSIEDGATVTPWRGIASYNSSYSDQTVNYAPSTSWKDVYDLSSITFTATLTSTSDDTVKADTPVTYSYFLVPYEIGEHERLQHLSDAQIVILDVIPLLIIVAVLLGVVAVFILRRE